MSKQAICAPYLWREIGQDHDKDGRLDLLNGSRVDRTLKQQATILETLRVVSLTRQMATADGNEAQDAARLFDRWQETISQLRERENEREAGRLC